METFINLVGAGVVWSLLLLGLGSPVLFSVWLLVDLLQEGGSNE